ncbi:ABC-type antimicrobial peptide transport system, permease component [Pelotomaculum thermopropionicum SI]|uniref:ABC-type antimicrobial peptide transport system, permease component n=1 Tax=Pelotomaculum thermopropionicum (strain DSM 13744 / JCM 10971 / SI) TaxID=370438 RepID=A5D294_PELTS|nr:ABC-type antimicrobial peptide transport system, permease component [Pelotomaculum thermopropionicum SI]
MLGIIIGVAAVIIMISVGQGASKKISSQISSLGSNLLMVFPGAGQGAVRGASGNVNTLTLEDAEAIAGLPLVLHVAPELGTSATIGYASQTWTAQVNGTTPEMQFIKDWPVSAGSFFAEEDVKSANLVAVLGSTVAENLFLPGTNPVGSTIRINRLAFTVVGVLSPKGASLAGQDQDNLVYVPVTTVQKRIMGVNYVRLINVQAETPESMNFVQSSVESLLRERHRLASTSQDDFNVRNLTSVLAAAENTTGIMTLLLASVAAVSLLVGGIGIMNIMLVSVAERTREIGLRMAVGATEQDIRNQFLVEALVLCLAGGVTGILAGVTGSKIISKVAGWPTYITAYSVLLSVGFSAAIGLFFGYYPAKKAAGLDPIESLRFEN